MDVVAPSPKSWLCPGGVGAGNRGLRRHHGASQEHICQHGEACRGLQQELSQRQVSFMLVAAQVVEQPSLMITHVIS